MAYNVELPDGGKIVVLYTRSFNWKSEGDAKLLNFQPESSRIYRAFVDPDNNHYFIQIDNTAEITEDIKLISGPYDRPKHLDGIRLTSLKYSTPEWDCDMVEVDDKNILDLNITSDDYRKLSEWTKNSHQDFVDIIYNHNKGLDMGGSVEDEEDEDLPDIIFSGTQEDFENPLASQIMNMFNNAINPVAQELNNNLKLIIMKDPLILEALAYVTSSLVLRLKKEDTSDMMPMSREVAMSDTFGKGANIYSILYNIEKYAQDNSKEALSEAIYHLLIEYARLKYKKNG